MISWLASLHRRRRRALKAKFALVHSKNVELWRGRWDEVWPGMAQRGPWQGFAEDLADESNNRPTLSGGPNETFCWPCWDYSGCAGVCARATCARTHVCERAPVRDLT